MTNRLPLALSTLKNLSVLISENSNNLWLVNPLKNVARDIIHYDYSDAIKGLSFLQQDYPNLMDYKKEVNAIKRAEKRYNQF